MFACTRNVTLLDSITNKTALETSKKETSLLEELTTTIKKRDLKLYGHVIRTSNLSTTILEGTT